MTAADRLTGLLTEPVVDDRAGYLDTLGETDTADGSLGIRAMHLPGLAAVYEKLWRPLFTRLFSLGGPTAQVHRRFVAEIAPAPDGLVLDVGCGPGLYTRRLASSLTTGLAVGLDFSPAMLARAVADNTAPTIAYLRADAHRIPLPDDTFDAVVCLAALYLMPDPALVLREMVRVTRPGGTVAVFTTAATRLTTPAVAVGLARRIGLRIFGRDEVTGRLSELGMSRIRRRIVGQAQFVTAEKPPAPQPPSQMSG